MAYEIQNFHKPTRKNVILNMMKKSAIAEGEDNKITSLAWKLMYYFLFVVDREDEKVIESALSGEKYIIGKYDEFLNLVEFDNPNTTRIKEAARTLAGFVGEIVINRKTFFTPIFKQITIDLAQNQIGYLMNEKTSEATLKYKETLLIDPQNACHLSSVQIMRLYEIYKQTIFTGPIVIEGNEIAKETSRLLFLKTDDWDSIKHLLVQGTKEININTEIDGRYDLEKTGKAHKITKLTFIATKKEVVDVSPRDIKEPYGRYNNVFLTKQELQEVKKWFPNDWDLKIDYLSLYLTEGKTKYPTDHHKELFSWHLNEEQKCRREKETNAKQDAKEPEKRKRGRPKKQPNPNEGKGINAEFNEEQVKHLYDLANAAVMNGQQIDQYLNEAYIKMCQSQPSSDRYKYL